MKGKIFVYMLTLCLIVACSFALTACSNEHNISIKQNDYLNISANVYTAKSEEKVTISYTKKENFVEKPGYELKFMVETNNQKAIVVNYDESGNYYFIMPDCDVSISAEYLPIQYTITYDLKGGENNANNPTTYTVDSNDIIISQPTYTNYYFSGWTINDGSQIVRDYTIPSGTTGNITLKANWKQTLDYSFYSTTYTGEELSVNASNFVGSNQAQFVEISGDTKATNAGTYEVTLSLKDNVNYCWKDGTTEDKTATWEIKKLEVLDKTTYEIMYSGKEKSVTNKNFVYNEYANLVDITGTTSATNVGTYSVILSLKDKVNYCWEDGTTEDKTVQWSIVPAKVSVNRNVYKEYTGDIITVTLADFADPVNRDLFTISGTTSATVVGTYNVILSLKNKVNYCWEDGTTGDMTISWEIKSRAITFKRPLDYYYPYHLSIEYSGNEKSITPYSYLANPDDIEFIDVTGTTSATNTGIYNITLSLKDKANYCWNNRSTGDKIVSWRITKYEINIRPLDNYAPYYYSAKYSGDEKSFDPRSFGSAIKYFDVTGTTSATNAGIYNVTLTLKDKENYCWKDRTTEDKTVSWRITRDIIVFKNESPSYLYTTVYSGNEQSFSPTYFVYPEDIEFIDITGTTSATNAGTYAVTLSLKDKENYCWGDEITEDKTARWSILPSHVYIAQPDYKEYTGDVITITPDDFTGMSDVFTISGTTSATNAGTYEVTLSLKDKENYRWEDETTEDKTAQWSIVLAKVSLNLPVTKQYTGDAITITPTDFADLENSKLFTISGTASATNVGTYNVTLSLKENYCWEDGTIEDKNVTWEIVKAKLTVTRYTPLYSGEEKIVTSVNLIAEDDYADFVTVSGQTSATEPGAYTVTLSLNDKINMTWSDGTTDDKTVKWKIQRLDWKNNVAVSAFVKKIYTGEEITVTSADFILAEEYADYITISGQTSGTEKGTYTVTISLADKENMTWDDDTTEDKTVQWIIAD